MNIRETETYKNMDVFTACGIAEGFGNENPTEEEVQSAWQYLYDEKAYRWLQGFYGRTMSDMLADGYITER